MKAFSWNTASRSLLRILGAALLLTLLFVALSCSSGSMVSAMPMHGSPVECGGMFSDELGIPLRELGSLIVFAALAVALLTVYHSRKIIWVDHDKRFFLSLSEIGSAGPRNLLTRLFAKGILHPKIY